MREYSFALGTAASAFALLVIGGLLHATGSSLSCPDWPLCAGQILPPTEGGVLFGLGHRFSAAAVGVLTVWLAVLVFRSRSDAAARGLAAVAVALLLVQAGLGALAVVRELPTAISASHLALSIALFAALIVLAWRLRPADVDGAPAVPRAAVALAAVAVYAQMVVGGVVRHSGAALACGTGVPLCRDVLWPSTGPAQLHLAHRLLGAAVVVLVVLATWRPAREALRAGALWHALLALAAPSLVLAEVALGFWTVVSGVDPRIVTAHLAIGALLLADLLALFLSLGGARRSRRRVAAARA